MRRSRNKIKDEDISYILDDLNITIDKRPFIQKVIFDTSYFIDLLEDRRDKRLDRKLPKDIKKLENALEIVENIRYDSPDFTQNISKASEGLKYVINSLQHIIENKKNIHPDDMEDFSTEIRTIQNQPQKNDILKAAA